MRKVAVQQAEAYRVHLEWALRQPGWRGRPISVTAAADKLNERNILSPRGGRWWGETVMRMGQRLGLHHPLAVAHRCVPYKHRRFYRGMDLPVTLYNADGALTLVGRAAVAKVRRHCAEAYHLRTRSHRPRLSEPGLPRARRSKED
jgi:hypothetical protein